MKKYDVNNYLNILINHYYEEIQILLQPQVNDYTNYNLAI